MPRNCISLLAAFCLMSLFGCGVNERVGAIAPTDESIQIQQNNSVMIRVANESNVEMKNIVITYYSHDEDYRMRSHPEAYGNLAPGKATDYHVVNASYSYAPMEAVIRGKQIRVGVTDFLGEGLIPNGNYTYGLTYDPNAPYTYDGLSGQLKYQQTTIDSVIEEALDTDVKKAIFNEYYGKYGQAKINWANCVHQQTHRKDSQDTSPAIVYANVVCVEPYFGGATLGEKAKKAYTLLRFPMRLELKQEGDSFSVTNYQFPRKAPLREKDIKKIFPVRASKEMERSKIREDTYIKLRLKQAETFSP